MNALLLALMLTAAPDALHGTVKDEAGKELGSVTVKVKDASGKALATAKSDKHGAFAVKTLTPGEYTLEFSATGFETETQSHFTVAADAPGEIDMVLRAKGKQKSLRPTQGGW